MEEKLEAMPEEELEKVSGGGRTEAINIISNTLAISQERAENLLDDYIGGDTKFLKGALKEKIQYLEGVLSQN